MRNGHYHSVIITEILWNDPESHRTSFFLKTFFFYRVLKYSQLTNNVVIVSGEPRRDSAIHIHVFILS